MPSTSAVLARPVRRRVSSCLSASMLLPMRVWASVLMSLIMGVSRWIWLADEYSSAGRGGRRRAPGASVAHQGAHRFAAHDAQQVARHRHVVDAQRRVVVAAQRDRGGVHHLEVALDHLVVGELVVAGGVRMAGGI